MTGQGLYPNQEVQIYTWPDATLRELCELLQDVVPSAADYNARLDLSLVFLDRNGNFAMKQVRLK
jgi:histone deacetylase complex subunit SAP18